LKHRQRTGGDGDNVFLVVRASYTDQGAPSAGPLTGEAVYLLQPRRKEGENYTHQSGVTNAVTADTSGGHDLVGIDHGDYVGFFPVNLTNIHRSDFSNGSNCVGRTN
jgi:hypothetical protein